MFSLHLQHFFQNKGYIIITIIMLVVVLTLGPTAFKMLWEGQEQVNADITDFARGDYDLLVRTNQSNIEQELGVVEENYLGVGSGGITFEQWEAIKQDQRVEIAAPVASLGFFTKVDHMYQLPKEDGNLRYTVRYKTTDGVNNYLVNRQKAYLFKDRGNVYDEFYPIELINTFGQFDNANFELPPTYHPVVAIDPESEEALTGIDFSVLNKEGLTAHPNLNDRKHIPLIDVAESSTPLSTEIKIEQLDVSKQEIQNLKQSVGISANESLADLVWYANQGEKLEEWNQVNDHLSNLETSGEQTYTIEFYEHLSPFEQEWYMINDQYQIVMESDYDIEEHGEAGRTTYYESQNVIYKASSPNYQKTDEGLSIKLLGQDGEVPIHRDLEKVQFQEPENNGDQSDLLNLIQVETVSVGEYVDSLAASPLGIYHYQYGNLKETGEQLQPTHHPGSFLSLPANGLISIDWADEYKGEAPIDAIRVKVAGISGYTEEAAQKIRQVAEDIRSKGLHVDIVAGASHQDIDVEVEDIGMVVMPWTTLGAAESIISSWNIFSIVIASSFILIALLSYVARLRTMEYELSLEKERLGILGWTSKTINVFYRIQWVLQFTLSVLLAFIIVLFIFGFDQLILIGFGLSIFILIITQIIFKSLFNRIKLRRFKPKKSYLVANLSYYGKHIQAAGLQLFLSTSVIAFLMTMLQVVSNRINVTDLGQYIHVQINELQIILLTSVIILTIYTLGESIYRMWQEREKQIEFLKIIGWQNKDIRKSYMKETMSWISVTVLIGTCVGIIAVIGFFNVNLNVVSLNLLIALAVLLSLMAVLNLGLRRLLSKGV